MPLADLVYRPFERLIRPLDLPLRPVADQTPLGVVLHFARMFRAVLVLVALSSIIIGAINLVTVWALAFIVDGVTQAGPATFIADELPLLVGFAALLLIVDPLVNFLRGAFMSQVVQVSMPAAMLWQGHKSVERQDMAFFHDLFPGQVASRLSQVSSAVQRELLLGIDAVPRFAIQFLGSAGLLLALAWPLAIPVLLWIAGNVALAIWAVPVYANRSSGVARTSSKSVGALADLYGNIQTVKLFAAEDTEAGAIRKIIGDSIDAQHAEQRVFISTSMAVRLMNAFLAVSVLAIGLWGMLVDLVSIGDFVAAVTIVRGLTNSADVFIGLGQGIARSFGTLRDAMPILTTSPTIVDAPNARPLAVSRGAVRFDRVDFRYKTGGPVFENLSLAIAAGEKIGLVGLSGAGKTTLVSLLLRLFDVKAGTIEIDGQNVRDVTQASLRDRIGVITQDVALFNRSVLNNIRYGKPDATRAEVEAAARLADAHEFIAALKDSEGRDGYDAFVGDRGVKLSGGQRQRIAIARVLLKDAPILVLDEATSALDSEAEAAIQEHLSVLMEGKTVIAIAHRLSTIARMDRIVVLDQGRIVEEGPPDELLRLGGLYARLWKRQTGGFLPDEELSPEAV